jgi:hypothetical protein
MRLTVRFLIILLAMEGAGSPKYPYASKRARPGRAPTAMNRLETSRGPVYSQHTFFYSPAFYLGYGPEGEQLGEPYGANLPTANVPWDFDGPPSSTNQWNPLVMAPGVSEAGHANEDPRKSAFYGSPQTSWFAGYGNMGLPLTSTWREWIPTGLTYPVELRAIYEPLRHKVLNYLYPLDFQFNQTVFDKYFQSPSFGPWNSAMVPGGYRLQHSAARRPRSMEFVEMLSVDLDVEIRPPCNEYQGVRATVFLLYTEAVSKSESTFQTALQTESTTVQTPLRVPFPEDYNYTDVPNGPAVHDPTFYESTQRTTIIKRWDFIFGSGKTETMESVSRSWDIEGVRSDGITYTENDATLGTAAITNWNGPYPYTIGSNEHVARQVHQPWGAFAKDSWPAQYPPVAPVNVSPGVAGVVRERVPLNLLARYDPRMFTALDGATPAVTDSPWAGLSDGMLSCVVVTNKHFPWDETWRPRWQGNQEGGYPSFESINTSVTGNISAVINYREAGPGPIHPRE